MLLCLGARFAKQRFCLYLEGKSVLGSLQGMIEPFTKRVGAAALEVQVVPVVRGACFCDSGVCHSRSPGIREAVASEITRPGPPAMIHPHLKWVVMCPFQDTRHPPGCRLPTADTAVEKECSACKRPRDSDNLCD